MTKLRKHNPGGECTLNDSTLAERAKNVVVFGESGVGKSSLINLIAGKPVSATSSGAIGCTLEYQRHSVVLDGRQYAIWDTAGLDEGSHGSVPADKAEAYLKQLLHELAKNDGVDLLVYCVRGTRVRSALLTNYHIFYSAICRRKVPIVIVITGLENQEVNMETWWFQNERQFDSLKMHFGDHACVTTLEPYIENPMVEKRRELSKEVVIGMITRSCRTQQWRPPERSWFESAYSDIRALLSPGYASGPRLPTIIMCDTRRAARKSLNRKRSYSFPLSSLSFSPRNLLRPVSISNTVPKSKLPFEYGVKSTPEGLYRVYQISPKGSEEDAKKETVVRRGADLLIFCVKMEGTETVKSQWDYFNLTYGGDLSPQIVVVVGAPDEASAEKWWEETVYGLPAVNDVHIAYYPLGMPESDVAAAQLQLQHLINKRCIDYSRVALTKNVNLFRRSLHVDGSARSSLWCRPDMSKEEAPQSPDQDVFTELGVWRDFQEPEPLSPTSLESPRELQGHCFASL